MCTGNVAVLMERTLEEVQCKLKTQLGVSADGCQHCEAFPMCGTGQGSGCSPGTWAVVSNLLFKAHAAGSHGATFQSYDRSLHVDVSMIGFVDDSSGQVNLFHLDAQPTESTLLPMMQHDAQLWKNLLHSSGGDLNLSKCSYHYHRFAFTADGHPVHQGPSDSLRIRLVQADNVTIEDITQLSSYDPHETLGHWKSPAGNGKEQRATLQKKSDAFATTLAKSPMERRDGWTFYTAMHIPSIGYTLGQSHHSQQQLRKIQKRAMQWIKPRSGYNRCTPDAVTCGSKELGGATFRSLYSIQGESQILVFLKFWRHPTSLPGQLLRITVSWVQALAGVGFPVFSRPSVPLPQLDFLQLDSFSATVPCNQRLVLCS